MRVVIGEDSVLLREGIARLLDRAGFEVVARAGDAEDVLRKVRAHKPERSSSTSGCRQRTPTTAFRRRERSEPSSPTSAASATAASTAGRGPTWQSSQWSIGARTRGQELLIARPDRWDGSTASAGYDRQRPEYEVEAVHARSTGGARAKSRERRASRHVLSGWLRSHPAAPPHVG
jgi:hypothetical protein